ncbi:MAG: peptidoglycan D,D-transpeptidase FtsI family protein, partial [Gemmatimonadaceae bacterium]
IAERSLTDAVQKMGAEGGDIVILDARSGEIRALASHRSDPRSTTVTALTEAYEPGSTLKPFIAAALLERKRARVDEVMNTYGGRWNYNGRIIEDDHKGAHFTLAEVLRYSSNIGIVQFAQRLSPREQFEVMRDAGFGAPTGTTYPSESPGRLAPPAQWSSQSPASMAMGYEVMVTPMQLATAYAAIANGGELLQPALVKEIRAADGTVTYRHERRVVRRIMSPETARTIRLLLKGVVEGGTGELTSLATYEVAGKTGTAQVAAHGHYVKGAYKASFVGMFPADDPQIVILVKLDSPKKSIYGGKAAAPVTKTILEAAIAARDAALDRRGLANAPQRVSATQPATPRPVDAAPAPAESVVVTESAGSVPFEISLEHPARPTRIVAGARAVPSVRGLSPRAAARALHRAGFRVSFSRSGGGRGSGTGIGAGSDVSGNQWPAAGAMAAAGSRVTVEVTP